jgi:AraC-like DNA-binding protein
LQVSGGPARFYCVFQGRCHLTLEGEREGVTLYPGDLVVTTPNRGHFLRDSQSTPTVSLEHAIGVDRLWTPHPINIGGGGSPTRMAWGCFLFGKPAIGSLLASLPPLILLKGTEDRSMMWWVDTLRLMIRESAQQQPGSQAIVDHLAQVILIQAIRSCMTSSSGADGGWLTALMDPDIGSALRLMHTQPQWPWKVASLADQVGMSRSAFAARFKALVSKPPQQYLLECRMEKACALLAEGQRGIKEIATSVGYATTAAFGNAFKRWSGRAPGSYRRSFNKEAIPSDHHAVQR